jgi:phosphomannomutase
MSLDFQSGRAPPEQARRPSRCAINPSALRAYDIRGVVGTDLDANDARALGLAFAKAARGRGLERIGVGRDGRLSSPRLERALAAGLVEGGMQVLRVGLGPTPMLAFAARVKGLDGAIMVTASHNPPAENGFKLQLDGERLHGETLRRLAGIEGEPSPGGSARSTSVIDSYVEALAAAAEGLEPMAVAWDCGHGATGPVIERLLPRLRGRHIALNAAVDGRFPGHHPDPAVAANLAQLGETVRAEGLDMGVAFDGDGDRVGVVDREGQVLWADQLLLLLAGDILRDHPGAAVVGDIKCSRVLFEGVAALGGRPVIAPSGYVHVRDAMRRSGALLAGELSGHVFFAGPWRGVDDAIYAAIRTLQAACRLPGGLDAFRASLPRTFATPELRIPCPEPRKVEVVQQTARRLAGRGGSFDPMLGLKVVSADGWWLLRASGTEPKLTCRCEASDAAGLERLKDVLRRELALSGIELGPI